MALAASAFTAGAQIKGSCKEAVQYLQESAALESASWGVLAVTSKGDTLVEFSSSRRFLPASNAKLITTGLALHILGEDFRFKTGLAYKGDVRDSVLHGDLYLVGGGDPTLAANIKDVEPLFDEWAKILTSNGIKAIDGNVIGDGRHFDGPIENASWSYEDLGTYYGAGCNGLSFYRNILEIDVAAGTKEGDPVKTTLKYPETPWLEYSCEATTAPASTGDKLYLFNTDLYPVASMRGTFAIDRAPKTEKCSNKFGALTCAYYFYKYLKNKGMSIYGGYGDVVSGNALRIVAGTSFVTLPGSRAAAPEDLSHIGYTSSVPLSQIARSTNVPSDNFMAESIFRELSLNLVGTASYDSAQVVVNKALASLMCDPEPVKMIDGSGLSRQNYVSPSFMCGFLLGMAGSDVYPAFLASLPRAGEGTLSSRLRQASSDARNRIRMKSGSMDGVRCFSGYILPASDSSDTVTFSIMTNNTPDPAVLSAVDHLLVLLASFLNFP